MLELWNIGRGEWLADDISYHSLARTLKRQLLQSESEDSARLLIDLFPSPSSILHFTYLRKVAQTYADLIFYLHTLQSYPDAAVERVFTLLST